MKFLLITLAIRFIIELFSNKSKTGHEAKNDETNELVRHPAEYELR